MVTTCAVVVGLFGSVALSDLTTSTTETWAVLRGRPFFYVEKTAAKLLHGGVVGADSYYRRNLLLTLMGAILNALITNVIRRGFRIGVQGQGR